MIQSIHKGVEIERSSRQVEGGHWIGECIVDPKGSRERLATEPLATRELAEDAALELARRHIDNTR